MSVHCAHCLIKILDTQKLLTNLSHGDLSSTHPHISLWQYLLSAMGKNKLLRTQLLLFITTKYVLKSFWRVAETCVST